MKLKVLVQRNKCLCCSIYHSYNNNSYPYYGFT